MNAGGGLLQTSLRNKVSLSGVGVHTGRAVTVILGPAPAGAGITFVHTNLDDGPERDIPADFFHVGATDYCTTLARGGASISTVEHLLAALAGLEVDNALIEIDGPEVPIMDGSASAFVDLVDRAGIVTLGAPRTYIRILRPVRVELGESFAELRPFEGRRFEIEIDYATPLIGRQSWESELSPAIFRRDLARARTFGLMSDVERLWSQGYALGASLENALVIGDDKVVNPEGMRFANECARHKAVDAIGDLALAGAPILGAYVSYRGGHRVNLRMLQALFAEPDAFQRVTLPAPERVVAATAAVAALS